MQTQQKTQDDPTQTAQAAQAQLCRTTVITGMDAFEDRTARLVALVKGFGHRGRFDLLTVPDSGRLPADERLFAQVARDAALAIKLHHGEQILVAVYGDPTGIVRALKERSEFRGGGVAIVGADLRGAGGGAMPMPAQDVAVTCMDFRQHDADLPARLREAFGLAAVPSVLAMAGGAKEASDAHPRGRRLIQRLKARHRILPIRRIVLTCHTDCGAMGGDAAPAFCGRDGRPSIELQRKVLTQHLKASALAFAVNFPQVPVSTGIIRLKDGKIDEVMATSA